MTWWFAAVMGVVQGLTEFIPISSTAHLRILPALFGVEDPGAAYTAVLQLGTLAAVIVYFAKDLIALPGAMVRDPSTPEGRLPWLLAAGTVPIVIAGLLLKKHIEGDLRSLYVVAIALITVGIALAVIDRIASGREVSRDFASITLADAVCVGLAQTLAVVPGVSRSGATICMALLLGISRSDSARFSFLLSIPAIAGAAIFELKAAVFPPAGAVGASVPALGNNISGLLIGTGAAFVVGYAAIAWLMKWLGSHDLVGFAIYRIVAGLALLAALLRGLL